ncbi:LysR family transcriptional regulator [Limibacter armeniacum]|uniref:LysR family transcriptional regulator n=1 Tax=Limibacter armeniacum TaxID=466084 RepID=UPI002FE69464
MLHHRIVVFAAVAEHGSFTKAAMQLEISQPAVTKQVKELEKELEVRLVDRKGQFIALTEAGKLVLAYYHKGVALQQSLELELSDIRQRFSGSLRVGASTTIAQYILPFALAHFYKKHPDVKVKVESGNTQQVQEKLIRGEIDFGIVEGLPNNRNLHYEPIIRDEIAVLVNAEGKYAQLDTLNVDQLKTMPVILREKGSGTLDILEQELEKQLGLRVVDMNIVMQLDSTEAIKTFVKTTDSIGFFSVPSVMMDIKAGSLKILDVEGLDINRMFYVIYPQGPAPHGMAAQLLKYLQYYHQFG